MISRTFTKMFVVGVVCALSITLQTEGAEEMAPVDPSIFVEIEVRGETTLWVLLKEQADLSPAFGIRDWSERGRFVHERLVETAETSQAGIRGLLAAWGAEYTSFWIVNLIQVQTVHSSLVSLLAARPEVAEIVAPPEVVPYRDQWERGSPLGEATDWNIDNVRAPEVWSTYGATGEGIVVGVIDSGVDFQHPALVDHYRGNLGGGAFDHNYNWYDWNLLCGDPSTEPCDLNGHGTATTGLAVGDDGGTKQIGVAPGATFIAAAVNFDVASLLWSVQWMLAPTDLDDQNPRPDLRPHVINNSWGFAGPVSVFQSHIQAWLAAGIFPAFAIHNWGPACDTAAAPASYPESHAVGAHDEDNIIADFSSRGPSVFDPFPVKPDITAPGVLVRTSVPVPLFPDPYELGTGTSFATPHVAGAVALMWSLNPELVGQVATTRLHLDRTSIDASDLSCGGEPGDNNVWGEGRLDAFEASKALFMCSFELGDLAAWSAVGP